MKQLDKNVQNMIRNNRQAIRPNWEDLRQTETPRTLEHDRPQQFKSAPDGAKRIALDNVFPGVHQKTFAEVVSSRRSLRQYDERPLTKEEISYLLYETARVSAYKDGITFRTIPTGGATNAMETYLYVDHAEGLERGLYHYLQADHELALIERAEDLEERVNHALYSQLRGASAVFVFTAVPARSEYKYSFCAHKMIAIEAGHAGQNLSLAAEVIDAGACAIAAYRQNAMDELLQLDIDREFATYAFTVGKKKHA